MKRTKLTANKGFIKDQDMWIVANVSMTPEIMRLIDHEGWNKDEESWLAYRERTAEAREAERVIQYQMAEDLANAYNEKYKL